MTRLIAILYLLASTCAPMAAHAQTFAWGESTREVSFKHVATGAAVGLGAEGLCIEVARRVSRAPRSWECFGGTVALAVLGYAAKEAYDARQGYEHGAFDVRDFSEGAAGAVVGAGIFLPLVRW